MIRWKRQQYEEIFSEPKSLPPSRARDHRIPLKPGTVPPNVRPYGYAYVQKNEIEKIVKELLESGSIQPSVSAFSSPVLLVKKKRIVVGECA